MKEKRTKSRDARFLLTVQTNAGMIKAHLDCNLRMAGLNVKHFDMAETIVRLQLRARGYHNLVTTNPRFIWEDEDGTLEVQYRHCQAPVEWSE